MALIRGSKGKLILVNEEFPKRPARPLNWSKLTFNYPLIKDFKLKVVPRGEPAGRVILIFSNDDISKGTYD